MRLRCCLAILFALHAALFAQSAAFSWPAETRESRPWSYWWWPGSAVDQSNLTRELEVLKAAGWGGVHVIPIYGVRGAEQRFIPYLSPQWMDMLRHTITEANRLGLGVDMTTGSGWCFGGPNISERLAAAAVQASGADPITISLRPSARVKRAAPGGEGYMLNPFSAEALRAHLSRFDGAFLNYAGPSLRAMYHDSFEYRADWSPELLDEFARRRGYRLEEHYDALFRKVDAETATRIKSDYRETLSDLLLENFTRPWVEWCRRRGFLARDQAHGSPANLLDLYAAADIPETEMFNADRSTLVSKFASSAAHTAGRRLVGAEAGTWLKEHFQETLGDLKVLVDQLFLSGVNHIIYHGTCYSPSDAAWPGWLFYASTELNSRNSIWRDVSALNAYVTRSQSLLQSARPASDLLIYWPVYDVWHNPDGLALNFTVHERSWVEGTPFGILAQKLLERGYSFDFVSDRQLATLSSPAYKAILVPATHLMPAGTISHLARLARLGVPVIFDQKLPDDVPGWALLDSRRAEFRFLLEGASSLLRVGDAETEILRAGVRRESLVDRAGLHFVRMEYGDGSLYFIVNRGGEALDGWVPLAAPARAAVLMDPMTGRTGLGATRSGSGNTIEVYLQLESGQSVFVRALAALPQGARWLYRSPTGSSHPLIAGWSVKFIEGGPELPPAYRTDELTSWTDLPLESRRRFAGTAQYEIRFDRPSSHRGPWLLDLGDVRESARVRINGRDAAALIMAPFRTVLSGLQPEGNVLQIEVTNLSANRIRDLDQRGVPWKIFYDINYVDLRYRSFDASEWELRPSGLLGPVKLTPVVNYDPR